MWWVLSGTALIDAEILPSLAMDRPLFFAVLHVHGPLPGDSHTRR